MVSSKTFLITLLALSVSAIPLQSREENQPKPSLDKSHECVWNDGHGDISCGYFSVVFGDNSVGGSKGTVTIRGETWKTEGRLDCGNDNWTTFTSPLPYTVDIHGGNACHTTISGHWDNTWIKYAAQYLDVPSDTRCGDVGTLNKSRRCIIPA
ncbi:uncharacterized protein NECHADRAFT_106298 [Fusarium vanettenii 77-13-4]|uniref:Uncharacterized protein n=1 Tax=Fusarium vanettenii (strain ATCC MYA-4622 / CBS 123669 / FGSC 9596 / NRRL 45880 / 77-13-4) TaxID=660122 RepID=C7Z4C2_FUSV7|nr:uncharacterized protein NECHADRAFT_106298 [Fusarium vanettenii 77-13-4]EEU41293.1 hypothetical protein NECHADRAFT_106298 [Fusarium vanettenii 77-13-4]